MSEKRKPLAEQSPENELDALNEETRTRRDAPRDHRRKIEASIEETARKRRTDQAPASGAIKKT